MNSIAIQDFVAQAIGVTIGGLLLCKLIERLLVKLGLTYRWKITVSLIIVVPLVLALYVWNASNSSTELLFKSDYPLVAGYLIGLPLIWMGRMVRGARKPVKITISEPAKQPLPPAAEEAIHVGEAIMDGIIIAFAALVFIGIVLSFVFK